MRVRVTHDIDDLASDLRQVAVQGSRKLASAVASNAREGLNQAKVFARESAGAHGKHYPNSMTAERLTPFRWEYGPDAALPQGGMSFEFGSRNQRPHLDLARSADIIGRQFADDIGDVVDGLFW